MIHSERQVFVLGKGIFVLWRHEKLGWNPFGPNKFFILLQIMNRHYTMKQINLSLLIIAEDFWRHRCFLMSQETSSSINLFVRNPQSPFIYAQCPDSSSSTTETLNSFLKVCRLFAFQTNDTFGVIWKTLYLFLLCTLFGRAQATFWSKVWRGGGIGPGTGRVGRVSSADSANCLHHNTNDDN